jgi:endonuclease/exonuclease/phosphatase family metal-dependent hydrolase
VANKLAEKSLAYLLIGLNVATALPVLVLVLATVVSPTTWYLPNLLALFAPYLLVIPVFWLAYWNVRKWRFALANLLLLLLNLDKVLNIYQFNPPRTSDDARQFSLVSFNVKAFEYAYGNVTKQAEFLKTLNPDVLCLQECYTFEDYRRGQNAKRLLANALGLKYVAFIQTARNYPFGLAVLSRYPIAASGRVTEEGRPNENGIMYADIQMFGQTVRFYNLHLASFNFRTSDRAHIQAEKVDAPALNSYLRVILRMRKVWYRQMKQVGLLKQHLGERYRHVVICGDLNNPPFGYVYREASAGLSDVWRARGRGTGFTYGQGFTRFRIDYAFVGQNLQVLDTQTVDSPLTDHKALVSRLRLEEF